MQDASDLAEMLFPGNRNQQYAFLGIWITLKWAEHHMVPNLGEIARTYDISKRTLERVRAKMRRMGWIDHVSRFNSKYDYKEGWVLSSKFQRSLNLLSDRVGFFRSTEKGSKDKDMLLLQFAEARREAANNSKQDVPEEDVPLE